MSVIVAPIFGALLSAALPTSVPEDEEPLVDLATVDAAFRFDLRYATADNFAGVPLYPVARCLLRESVARRMVDAQRWLDRERLGLRLLLKDCYRPDRAQRVLFLAVKGTPRAAYVANPFRGKGSLHSYGAAVDVTLEDEHGNELDMGTPYDFLGTLAEPRHEARFLAARTLAPEHVARRKLLRRAMVLGGRMVSIPNEWWHFDLGRAEEVRKKYSRLDVPIEGHGEPGTTRVAR